MAPPAYLNLDVEAISGICGSISIACWVVVFSPQIVQNFQRGSADALSVQFIIVWLIGDFFNIIGAVLQNVLPTMIILAVYYTLADLVLLCQCFYYRGFTWKDPDPCDAPKRPDERAALLGNDYANSSSGYVNGNGHHHTNGHHAHDHHDWTNLSPAVPLVSDECKKEEDNRLKPLTVIQSVLWNTGIIIMVCAAGVLGWALGHRAPRGHHHDAAPRDDADVISFSVLGQVFGYLCAAAYIGSRIPQIILNARRRSTEGLSMLFFLFACLGNVTYVLSILAFEAPCSRKGDCAPGQASDEYGRYILVNLSWVLGSSVTLLLDLCVFAQYFMYDAASEEPEDDECRRYNVPTLVIRSEDEIERIEFSEESSSEEEEEDEEEVPARRQMRPLLRRGDSTY